MNEFLVLVQTRKRVGNAIFRRRNNGCRNVFCGHMGHVNRRRVAQYFMWYDTMQTLLEMSCIVLLNIGAIVHGFLRGFAAIYTKNGVFISIFITISNQTRVRNNAMI